MFLLVCSVLALAVSGLATPTTIQKHPFHVSIENEQEHLCSGALIARELVLTLASCIKDIDSNDLQVRAGADNLKESGVLVDVKEMILHRRYQSNRKDFDIAIIVLKKAFTLNEKIQLVDLPHALNPPKYGSSAQLTGFGIDSDDELTQELGQAQMVIDVPGKCKNAYASDLIYITERMFCASQENGKLCKGDPGSPLVAKNVLFGLSVYEKKCGRIPGIYTDVSNLRNWIRDQVDL